MEPRNSLGLKELLATGPLWLRLAVAVAFAVLGALGYKACKREPGPAPVNVTVQPAPVTVVPAAPAPGADVETAPAERDAPLRHVWAKMRRSEVGAELHAHGFAQVGGPKNLTKDQVATLLQHLDDATIYAAAQDTGALGDGGFLKRLGDILRWPFEHPEQRKAILKRLLQLLLIIAPLVLGDLPAGG